MNICIARCAATLGPAVLLATAASAAVNISTQPTQNMSCSGGVCTATAQKAYLNVHDLTSMLAAGDLKIATGDASAEDIHVEAPFSWTSTSRLTLNAQRSIEFKEPVTVAGTGALTLITNDGGTGGDYWFDEGANVTFWDRHSSLIVNGLSFTLVPGLKTLIDDIAHHPLRHYALARDYDAAQEGSYGHSPIDTQFGGIFDGLGHNLFNLSISDSTTGADVGLFASIGPNGIVRNVRLLNVHVSGGAQANIGALVGTNGYGTLLHDEVKGGDVIAQIGGEHGGYVGGMIGSNGLLSSNTAVIAKSLSSVTVMGATNNDNGFAAGGLVGGNYGSVSESSATGNVRQAELAGGLVGFSEGPIQNSHASGNVTDRNTYGCIGGLLGEGGNIVNSFATGSVIVGNKGNGGGLAGCGGGISNSYATGTVTVGSEGHAGGLTGRGGDVESSFATGSVTAGDSTHVGGLAGDTGGTIFHSFALGAVSGGSDAIVGGFVGSRSAGTFEQDYSTGAVSGGASSVLGGFMGRYKPGRHDSTELTYFDSTTSGKRGGSGTNNCSYQDRCFIRALKDAQLKSALPYGFDPAVWGQNPNINGGYPYLLANPPPKSK